jgi:hypothetical protein
MSEILDFTDYAEPLDFKYNNQLYRIPALNKDQIEKLMSINKDFFVSEEDLLPSKENEVFSNDQISKAGKFFDMQEVFITTALLKKVENDWVEVEVAEVIDWPVKVKNRIMSAVSEQMAMSAEEEEINNPK